MKLLDPFAGYRLAYGNEILHIGYFVAILILPQEKECSGAGYLLAKKAMIVSHILVFFLSIFIYALKWADMGILSRALNWLSIFFYQGSIFYV
jgi:hypothetical protein